MSNYPPAPPYGAYSQPQTNAPYPQPSYPNQYMQQDNGGNAQTHMASNYNAAAYAYNNSIPGFSAGTLAPAAPPLPIYQGWNQDAAPLPSYSTPQSSMPYAGYGYQAPQSYVPQPQTYHQNTQHVAQYDEGEVSEGEFDAYAGQNNAGTAPADYGSNYYQENDGTGYMNTANRAVYPNGQDYNQQHYSSGNDYNNYQRESDSYSPYAASPQEVGQDERWKGKQNENAYLPAAFPEGPAPDTSWTQSSAAKAPHSMPVEHAPRSIKPATDLPLSSHSASPARYNSTLQGGQSSTTVGPNSHSRPTAEAANQDGKTVSSHTAAPQTMAVQTKSVAEYRKKAEGAILNLWSREVRFPDYVEEGLNAEIVGSLFDELGFSKAPKTANVESKNEVPAVKALGNPSVDLAKVVELSNGDAPRGVLVESNGNNASTSTTAPTAITAEAEPTEKEKNLKTKMEALRKSRADRAQKAAAKTSAQPLAVATTPPQSQLSIVASAEPQNSRTTSPLTTVQPMTVATPLRDGLPSNNVHPTNQVQPPPSTTQPVPPAQPIIPGLFLASTSSPAPLPGISSTMIGGPPNNQRKRPVAADFDTPTSAMPYKRPFGQSRNDSLVIDVSEEDSDSEEEDVAMDLDSQADQDSPLQAARTMSDQRTAALKDFPLTNFPSRRAFISPPGSSAASTPPAATAPRTTLGQPKDLRQTEKKIEELKKMIVAAEAAKAAKRRAQQTSSGAATPHLQPVNGTAATNGDGDIASKVEASLQIQQLIEVADDKVATGQKRLADTQAAEQEKAAELKRNEAESRRLRRDTLAADLPRVDAEVEESQRKLQELREAMAKIEASVQKSMDEKKRMADEMERLGQEAEDQLQEQKDKLESLTRGTTASASDVTPYVALQAAQADREQIGLPSRPAISDPSPTSAEATSTPATSGQGKTTLLSPVPGVQNDELTDSAIDNAPRREAVSASVKECCRLYVGNIPYAITEAELQSFFKGYRLEHVLLPKNPRTEQPVGYAFVEVSTPGDAERAVAELSGKKILDREVSVQLARPEGKPKSVSGGEGSRRPSTNGADHSSSGSDQALEAALQEQVRTEAESHEHNEEDMDIEDSYAPDPAQLAPKSSTNSVTDGSPAIRDTAALMKNGEAAVTHLHIAQNNTTMAMDVDQDDENDDYEPPEATPPVDVPSPIESPPFSPAPPESVTDFENFSMGRGGLENTAGNDEEELQVNGHTQTEEPAEPSNQIQFFTPYESPLKYFRAFRFHPDFKQQVSGGLKSMTYSHKISPNTEFCRYELAGGVCNDKTCDLQHFRDITLADDAILSNLGNPTEFPADQQQKFREGLKNLLIDLRQRHVRDFDTIATEVLAHRSTFLNDPSKVLMLEGTTI